MRKDVLLIDAHDRPVEEIVWGLFAHTIERIGPVPTLIEWDANLPDWPTLKAEAERAELMMVDIDRVQRRAPALIHAR